MPHLHPKLFTDKPELVPTRDGYGIGLVQAGEADPNVVALCADLTESTRTQAFAEKFPERFFEVGVAEQHMLGLAAGLAMGGKIPYLASYAVFSPGRNWDQLRVSAAYSNLHSIVAGAHAGLSVGPDGATHQALEDIALLRAVPNVTIVVPCDAEETRKATLAAAHLPGVVYLRFAREKTPVITTAETPFVVGKASVLLAGRDVTLVACGPLVAETLFAAKELNERHHISAEVINCHTIKPLDRPSLIRSFKKTGAVVTVEEHQIIGGLHGAVAELAAQEHPVPIEPVGMPNCFGESGEPGELLEKYGMTVKDIVKAAMNATARKVRAS
jgi:transketolase